MGMTMNQKSIHDEYWRYPMPSYPMSGSGYIPNHLPRSSRTYYSLSQEDISEYVNKKTTNDDDEEEEKLCSSVVAANGDDGPIMTARSSTTCCCWEEIPTEILMHILSAIPMRKLIQYMCLSKTWFHTISHYMDPSLLSANQEPGLIVIQWPRKDFAASTRLSFNVINKESSQGGGGGGGLITTKNKDFEPFEVLFSNKCSHESSCNGLICLKQHSSFLVKDDDLIESSKCRANRIFVCNPYLLEATTLPNINSTDKEEEQLIMPFKENYGLGFSPSTNQYKVVRITWFDDDTDSIDKIYRLSFRKNKKDGSITSYIRYRRPEEIKILTLGTNSSWRNVSSVPPYPIYGTPVSANGSLHWKVDKRNSKICHSAMGVCIVSFDIGKEEFYITPTVDDFSFNWRCIHLINLKGCLAMVYKHWPKIYKHYPEKAGMIRSCFDIWVLQQQSNNQQQQQQWVREYHILNPLEDQHHLHVSPIYRVIGQWGNGEIMWQFSSTTYLSYDPKTNKHREIKVRRGFGDHDTGTYQYQVYGHTGSLVSLKHYGCNTWRAASGMIPNLYDCDDASSRKERLVLEFKLEKKIVQL